SPGVWLGNGESYRNVKLAHRGCGIRAAANYSRLAKSRKEFVSRADGLGGLNQGAGSNAGHKNAGIKFVVETPANEFRLAFIGRLHFASGRRDDGLAAIVADELRNLFSTAALEG